MVGAEDVLHDPLLGTEDTVIASVEHDQTSKREVERRSDRRHGIDDVDL
jgi:hypothetical protein